MLAGRVGGLSRAGAAAPRRRPAARGARPARGRAARAARWRARRSRRCCASELGFRGFRPRSSARREAAAAAAERDRGPRRDLTALRDLHRRPGHAPATSTTPSPPSARATAPASGSTSPTSPPTCGRARRSTARRGGAANSTYVPGAVEPMLPHALSSEACSLAPGVERLAVTAEIELGPAMEPRASALLPQPHPLRRPPRLRPARRDLRRPRRGRRPRSPNRWRRRARSPRRSASTAAPTSLDVESRRARVPASTPPATWSAPTASPQTESHRLIERLMILTNEQVAELLERERVPAIYRVHAPARPDPGRTPGRAAGGARGADAAAGPGPLAAAGGQVAAEASRLVAARGRAARARPRGVYIARAPIPQAGPLQRAQQRPRRPRQRRLLPLHLADPPLPRPGRATGRCWRCWGRGRRRRAWPRPATSPPTARRASASRRRSSATPTTSAPPSCSNASSASAGRDAEFEGEVSGVIRAGAFVSFGGELGDVYEGMLPARRLPGEALRARPSRGGAGRPRLEGGGAPRRPDIRPGQPASTPPRGRVDLEPADG